MCAGATPRASPRYSTPVIWANSTAPRAHRKPAGSVSGVPGRARGVPGRVSAAPGSSSGIPAESVALLEPPGCSRSSSGVPEDSEAFQQSQGCSQKRQRSSQTSPRRSRKRQKHSWQSQWRSRQSQARFPEASAAFLEEPVALLEPTGVFPEAQWRSGRLRGVPRRAWGVPGRLRGVPEEPGAFLGAPEAFLEESVALYNGPGAVKNAVWGSLRPVGPTGAESERGGEQSGLGGRRAPGSGFGVRATDRRVRLAAPILEGRAGMVRQAAPYPAASVRAAAAGL